MFKHSRGGELPLISIKLQTDKQTDMRLSDSKYIVPFFKGLPLQQQRQLFKAK